MKWKSGSLRVNRLALFRLNRDLLLMCGRFVASSSPEEVRRWFRTTNPVPNFNASYDVTPTDSIPVVRFNPKTRDGEGALVS